MPERFRFPLGKIATALNRPAVLVAAIVLGVGLGLLRVPLLEHLQPVGEFYVALLQICVLPFLLATIPLAVRSALTSGSGGEVVSRLAFWLFVTSLSAVSVALLVAATVFRLMPHDPAMTEWIGILFGAAAERVDIEMALNPVLAAATGANAEGGLLAILPTNIFSALASNDSLRVIIFAAIFGAGMVISERRSGNSIFGALKHIQTVCVLIFDWFNLLTPIGIVALIAPQVARIGPDIYNVLAPFASALLATGALLLAMPILAMSAVLRRAPRAVLEKMLKPLALVVATRNALICVPAALETLKDELHAQPEHCDLYIPVGFAVVRFGPLVHFSIATLFIGYLMGRSFSGFDLLMIAALSFVASFATIGVSGVASLAPLALVLRPFGLSYELVLPLIVIVDPVVSMLRGLLNVALNSQIPLLAAWRRSAAPEPGTAAAS